MSEIDTSPEALRALADAIQIPRNLFVCDDGRSVPQTVARVLEALAAEKEASAPSGDGWIKWEGGKRPVSVEKTVEVFLADGTRDTDFAVNLYWHHGGASYDIVAYRVVEDA